MRLNIGTAPGLVEGSPVLFSENSRKIAAGRVVRVSPDNTIVAVLEHYDGNNKLEGTDYEFLFGEPFDEADNLPDYVTDREEETPNPANERFFTNDGKELENNPELDDDDYTPEVTLRPKLPQSRTYSTHNLTLGMNLFRNRALPSVASETSNRTSFTTYQGYSVRYAYTFRTHYWLKQRAAALISVEASFGIYNFAHKFPSSSTMADIRVVPLGFNLRYMIEVNKLFRLYPYIGYQNNLVSATSASVEGLSNIRGSRLLGGAGAQLVMSDVIDTRLEGGSDGVLMGLVVKF